MPFSMDLVRAEVAVSTDLIVGEQAAGQAYGVWMLNNRV
ncbi:hypothetical protein AF72_00640 [Xylella taiwanensis]|uniref:Uncharacterized protein n=1 Tax=Xylella taiwanensis TaxID=1444770 RepID=Z9JMN4_9GAMM|nr:hypothetical protein AF72_00640 [Xylella taiwanensis]